MCLLDFSFLSFDSLSSGRDKIARDGYKDRGRTKKVLNCVKEDIQVNEFRYDW